MKINKATATFIGRSPQHTTNQPQQQGTQKAPNQNLEGHKSDEWRGGLRNKWNNKLQKGLKMKDRRGSGQMGGVRKKILTVNENLTSKTSQNRQTFKTFNNTHVKHRKKYRGYRLGKVRGSYTTGKFKPV
jgi:hypothetical protein